MAGEGLRFLSRRKHARQAGRVRALPANVKTPD